MDILARTPRRRRLQERPRWRYLVPVVCLVAGFGFATSARDSRGTDLRAPGITSLADTVRSAEARVRRAGTRQQQLQAEVQRQVSSAATGDSAVATAQKKVTPLLAPAGLRAATGPGLEVVLNDAPAVDGSDALSDNQRLVHQSDLQAVVNALWAGGAEAMSIAGQRVVATSAVRCVGPTLLLNGEVFSPPYRVAAIGPAGTMQQELDDSYGVHQFRDAADYFGLGYTVETDAELRLPAYAGSLSLTYARPDK